MGHLKNIKQKTTNAENVQQGEFLKAIGGNVNQYSQKIWKFLYN